MPKKVFLTTRLVSYCLAWFLSNTRTLIVLPLLSQ